MPLIPFRKVAATRTPASVFAEKYEFLIGWALHFTNGDRAAAEDLVHETFLRFVLKKEEIEDPQNAEPLLYTYLKRVHSAQVRRMQRYRLQSATTVEFDSLQMSLREQCDVDPVKVQSDLRRIMFYLCWRKQDVKSASVLLLRFFHGYFPEQIGRICLLSRPSVDYALNAARDEVRLYLHDPERLRILHGQKMPEFRPLELALPLYDLMDELRETLFEARQTICLPKEELLDCYRAFEKRPIPRELLAHIVSCRECLDCVNADSGFPPISETSSEVILSQAKRSGGGFGKKKPAKGNGAQRFLEVGARRLREVLEHHPRTLMVSIDGEIIASQDVQSTKNTQRVEVKNETAVELIEVLSEQGVCLLPILLRAAPPNVPPAMWHEVLLSDNRSLKACISFTVHGYVIEVSYSDPTFFGGMLEETRQLCERELSEPADKASLVPRVTFEKRRSSRRKISLPASVSAYLSNLKLRPVPQIFATGIGALIAFIICFATWIGVKPIEITANTLLVRSQVWDTGAVGGGKPGVVRQRLTIRAQGVRLDRTIYRDLEGKRRWKEHALSGEDEKVRERLAAAGIAWDSPFSATNYQEWHDHQHVRRDTIARPAKHLLKLTTTVPDGAISEQSITVRDDDFHPVERTAAFRDGGTVEIAEVEFEILPWSRVGPDLFDPVAVTVPGLESGPDRQVSLSSRFPPIISDAECDAAELGTLLVLNRLHADVNEQIDVSRQAFGIRVKGVVATMERKRELEEQLRRVPHVIPSIHTYDEMEKLSAAQQEITKVVAINDIERSTSLQRYLTAKGWDRDDIGKLSQSLSDTTIAIERDSRAITALEDRFAGKAELGMPSRIILDQLLAHHWELLMKEISEEHGLLAKTDMAGSANDHKSGSTLPVAERLSDRAERLRLMSKELLSDSDSGSRGAERIVPEFVESLDQLETIANSETTTSNAAQSNSTLPATPYKNQ